MSDLGNKVSEVAAQVASELTQNVWVVVRGPGVLRISATAYTNPAEAREDAEKLAEAAGETIQWHEGLNDKGWYSQPLGSADRLHRYYVTRLDLK